ncbi:beta-ketoacyl-ACP synthase 3 [Lyngbya confervoides]|uniref:Beta-ketoacyl-[acyl-carrier-protein] synthase III n=1 Tax=Lyngbya confervoides BDU141951 TaxID=1574623 RepID=A0ABD4T8M9_9CYAN|nr:beta-ketoacyl-ACP synthase 3 [Lyngbya confervoides]MCM1984672.1 beta-ketoacyl-ACP synthase 3 [Lyngbya confervoides BDU141951]
MRLPDIGIVLQGCGSATPEVALSNDQLSQVVETSDEWISTRTGIRSRRLASPHLTLATLAAEAGRRALEMAAVNPTDVDLIILATSSPDDLFGSAGQVQAEIGACHAVAFDLTAACSGFIFGLVNAAQFIRMGVYRNVLLIGADFLSRWVDWRDRRTCVLFGDGAGAVLLQAADRDRLHGFAMQSDGTKNCHLTLPFQATPQILVDQTAVGQGTYQPIYMNGQEVYRFAVRRVPEILEKALFHAKKEVGQVDWLLLHQANQRILDAVAQRLHIPAAKVISHMAEYGNTSAASIPLTLDAQVRQGQIQPGDLIASAGFGAGLSWGAAIFEWK